MTERAIEPAAAAMSRRAVIAGGAMALAAGTAYAMRPRPVEGVTAPRLGPLVPSAIGPWRHAGSVGLVVARAEDEEDGPADGYDQLVTRVYAAPGLPTIMLLLAYGAAQGGGLQLHRPETCYPGQGFVIRDFGDADLHFPDARASVRGRRFTAVRDERVERLIYWTRIADRFPKSTFEEYGAILASALAGGVADGLLVRMSTVEPDPLRADAALNGFAHGLVAAVPAAARRMLIGSGG